MSFLISDDTEEDYESYSLSPLQEQVYAQLQEEPEEPCTFKGAGSIETQTLLSQTQPLFIIIDYFYQQTDSNLEIIVRLWPGVGHEERFVHLQDQWATSKISIGDTAFVIGEWKIRSEQYGFYTNKLSTDITNSKGYFILLPQVLIQGTRLSASQECPRKAYLSDFIASQPVNIDMFKGIVVHELIQSVLKGTLSEDINAKLDNILESKQEDLYLINQTTESIKSELNNYVGVIRKIAQMLETSQETNSPSTIFGQSDVIHKTIDQLPPYGCKTVNEEENIWSFQWGMKGKIDATLKQNGRLFPLELKSGSSNQGSAPRDAHILQLASYIFMLKEKYPNKAGRSGIIYYAKDSVSFEITPKKLESMHILIKRNIISHAISHGTVPETTQDVRSCKFCNGKAACAFLESGEKRKSKIANHLKDFISYEPKKQYIDFYKKWEKILLDEMFITRSSQTMIWLRSVEKRIEDGRAIGHLTAMRDLVGNLELVTKDPSAISNSMIQLGDFVMLTKSGRPPIIGRGRIIEIKDNRITLEMYESSFRSIKITGDFDFNTYDEMKDDIEDSKVVSTGNNIEESNLNENTAKNEIIETDLCIDKWETTSSVDICRSNLMSLFTSTTGSHLIDLVVDYGKPGFNEVDRSWQDPKLNDDQNNAIQTAIAAREYMLLLGMPGTGKTTLLVSLIKRLVEEGNRILVASYTHTAVDNICLKLNDERVNYIRFARTESVHPGVANNSIEKILGEDSTSDEIRSRLEECQVFATTCLGCSHPLLDIQSSNGRSFDVCVIDEASQISLPTVLGPISKSKRFILVGDHYQLPPITRYSSGHGEESPPSLFRLLCEANPEAIVTLRTQYRMNDEILNLCNKLVYGFRMRTGARFVGNKKMKLAHLDSLNEFAKYHQNWVSLSVRPNPSVVFYNTDNVPMIEMKGKGSKQNEKEAATVSMIVVSLVLCGLFPSNIGVISPYRSQVNLIRSFILKQMICASKFFPSIITDPNCICEEIEVHTVDRFQGRDKECIIFSSVKSNKNCSPGTHITDWQRLNVAITRAKTKFILIGSNNTLSNSPFFKKLLKIIDRKSIFDLPNDFDEVDMKPFAPISRFTNHENLSDSQF